MLANGNSNVAVCVHNLLLLTRGEVPYDRIRGIDSNILDKPVDEAQPLLEEDIRWLLETYEPRADLSDLEISNLAAQVGDFGLEVDIDVDEY